MTRIATIVRAAASPARDWLARPASSRPSLAAIEDAACAATGVSQSEIRSTSRHHEIVRARQIRALLARTLTHFSYHDLADAWGMVSFSSVLYQHRAGLRLRETAEFAPLYERALELATSGCGTG